MKKTGIWVTVSLFFFLFSPETNAQKISKYYTSTLQNNGTLYFIFPQDGFKNSLQNSSLVFDLTYLSSEDSGTMNFSYFDKTNLDIDSIILVAGKNRYANPAKKIYVDTKKQKWKYRYSSKILFSELTDFYNQPEPPEIILSAHQKQISLKINNGSWKKYSSINRKIISLIHFNLK